jgi:hypothetical protein
MLHAGDVAPAARVWAAPRQGPVSLAETLAGGRTLLCFYLWDWSPT